jgi:hypothetical protein
MKNYNELSSKVTVLANNQFVTRITSNNCDFVTFQSYDSIVCIIDYKDKIITFGKDYAYSKTTLKYLYEFLTVYFCVDNYNKKYIQKMIKD